MNEDFGDFGDEALLGRDEYLREIAEMQAINYVEREAVLRSLSDDAEDEAEANYGDMLADSEPFLDDEDYVCNGQDEGDW